MSFRSVPAAVLALAAIAGGTVVAALCLGGATLHPAAAVTALLDPSDPAHVVVTQSRLPRALLGLVAGAAMAGAGLLLQDSLRNPVAGPELLGVSSGAAVVTVAVVVLGLPVPLAWRPQVALVGALAAGAAVLLAVGRTRDPERVVLVGAAVSAAAGGLVVALVGLGTDGDVVLLFRYLLGSLVGGSCRELGVVGPWVAAGLVVLVLLRRPVAALGLGDEAATGLGVAVLRTRVLALVTAAVLAGAVASVCGPIAWVALLAPHLARAMVGANTRRTCWVAPPIGAVLLAAADVVARQLLYPVEVPVGIVTTVVGVPALVVLTGLAGRGRSVRTS